MNGKELLKGFGYVNDEYVEEAAGPKAVRLWPWRGLVAAAACLAVVLAALTLLPGRDSGVVLPPDGGEPPVSDSGVDTPDDAAPPQTGALVIDMGTVAVNELGAQPDACRIWLDPEKYSEARWTKEDVRAYYGRDPFPAYVPEGLSCPAAADPDETWLVYTNKSDGFMCVDQVGREYATEFYPDSGAVSGALGGKTVSVRCSRLGLVTDCLYLLPEDEVRLTDIAGAAVTFGYRQMDHGPYDPDTHEPAGYFDLYTAEFTLDGVEYEIVTEGLPAEEIVKVTASIVTGSGEVEVR